MIAAYCFYSFIYLFIYLFILPRSSTWGFIVAWNSGVPDTHAPKGPQLPTHGDYRRKLHTASKIDHLRRKMRIVQPRVATYVQNVGVLCEGNPCLYLSRKPKSTMWRNHFRKQPHRCCSQHQYASFHSFVLWMVVQTWARRKTRIRKYCEKGRLRNKMGGTLCQRRARDSNGNHSDFGLSLL